MIDYGYELFINYKYVVKIDVIDPLINVYCYGINFKKLFYNNEIFWQALDSLICSKIKDPLRTYQQASVCEGMPPSGEFFINLQLIIPNICTNIIYTRLPSIRFYIRKLPSSLVSKIVLSIFRIIIFITLPYVYLVHLI